MLYRVNTTCQYQSRLYEKGEIVDLPAEAEHPPYFDLLKNEAAVSDEEQTDENQIKTPKENEDTPPSVKRGRKK